jgi:hypothetical protein
MLHMLIINQSTALSILEFALAYFPAGPADVAHEDDGPMRFRGNGGESTTRPRRGAAVPGTRLITYQQFC